jgi:hypothetical protein
MSSTTIHGGASARNGTAPTDPPTIQALLRARTRYFERHVLAWYASGRVQDARAAWTAVCELRGD